MTEAVARILQEAERLTVAEREEISDRLAEGLGQAVAPSIHQAHISEVHRRIAEVESGNARLVPGEAALAQVRKLVESARTRS